MSRAFIGVGSNEEDRLRMISEAVRLLSAVGGVRVAQMATILETEPISEVPQARYLNTVVELETTLAPRALLDVLKTLERQLGRVPSSQRWGPRPIDLDILLYDDRVITEPDLVIPHPRLHERRFVLEPLSQLAPDLAHPVLKQTVADMLAAVAVVAT